MCNPRTGCKPLALLLRARLLPSRAACYDFPDKRNVREDAVKAFRFAAVLATLVALVAAGGRANAETAEIRVSKGYGILYLPLIVMADQKLLEKHTAKAGLGDVKVTWHTFDGGNVINDAMLAGAIDIAGTGAPGFIALWSKARGTRIEVIGVSGLSSTSLYLNSNNPAIKSLADFTEKDRIALPGIKTSLSAVVLQMAVAKQFGVENYAKLDPITVSLPHPEGLTALLAGKTEVTAHFTSPPFSYLELKDPKIKRVLNSVDVLGNITLDVVFASKPFVDANPKTLASFLAALDEANETIAKNIDGAADIFVRASKVKVSKEEVVEILKDPDTRFSATPNGVMNFADFMHRAGTIKVKPASWSDLFVPALHARPGS
jgi:NitT/TauT family transport system substrate-binding protein